MYLRARNSGSVISIWETPECPFRIEFPPAALEEIRIHVIEAFYSLPRGGVEIGGILFGSKARDCIRVTASRGIHCEHAFGPSFTLSPKDQAALTEVLEQARKDPALKTFVPVGWYHSHTRSEIFLSPADLDLYDKFFPENWQIALVLRPANMEPTRAGFFFRDAAGQIQSKASCKEFVLEPDAPASPAPARPAAIPPPVAPVAPVAPQSDALPSRSLVRDEPPTITPIVPPSFLVEQKKGSRRAVVTTLLLILVGGLAGAAYRTKDLWLPAHPEALGLEAIDAGGQLLVRWNRATSAVQHARSGILEIKDGDATFEVQLDPARLKSGGYRYERKSERVDLQLIVQQPGAKSLEEWTSFVGALPVHVPTVEEIDAQRKRKQAEEQADKIKTDLFNQNLRTRRLERTVDTLRRQLQDEKNKSQPAPREN